MDKLLNHLKPEYRDHFARRWLGLTRLEIHRRLDGMFWLKKYGSDEWQYRHLFDSPPPWLGNKVKVVKREEENEDSNDTTD